MLVACFVDPPAVELAIGSALAEIATDDGSEWYVASLDIANAFYSLALPPELCKYFCLPSRTAGALGVSEVAGQPVSSSTRVYPQLAVVPMGWTHALAICQRIHEHIADQAGLHPHLRSRDTSPFVSTQAHDSLPRHVECVDNFASLGVNKACVDEALNNVLDLMSAFRSSHA